MTNEKRLNELKMITCEERRNIGDLLQMFRFTKGFGRTKIADKKKSGF
jgi:hypothetical protein